MMKQKVGILTTYFASNFGAMLQPFALKRHIEQLGYDVEMIRYKQPLIERYYNPWKLFIFKTLNPLTIASYLLHLPEMLVRDYAFKQFMYKHINSERGYCKTLPKDKDFYFIGSDQIWNPRHTGGFDDIYFGKFDVKKGSIKASYAASAENIDYTNQQVSYLKINIKNFDYVSVREVELENNIRNVTGRPDICTVLDPTMLVDPKVYDEIKCQHPCIGEKFIFFYDIRNCKKFADRILDHAKSINARLVIVSEMPDKWYKQFAKKHKEVIYAPCAGIEFFLGGMKYAEFIYTASFHGTVFAILNHKTFHTLNLRDDKMTRPLHLLSMLGLSNRLLALEDNISEEEIDYSNVDKLLDEQRAFSRNFVLKVLNANSQLKNNL